MYHIQYSIKYLRYRRSDTQLDIKGNYSHYYGRNRTINALCTDEIELILSVLTMSNQRACMLAYLMRG